jgi:hypothetical protein
MPDFRIVEAHWLLVEPAAVDPHTKQYKLHSGAAVLHGDFNGLKVVFLFSAEDLADRFAKAHGTRFTPATAKTPQDFVDTLGLMGVSGCTHVTVDAGGEIATTIPIWQAANDFKARFCPG